MTKRARVYLGISMVLAAIGFLIYSATQGNTMFYLTVDEAASKRAEMAGKPVRMKGAIDQSSVTFDIRQPLLRFQVRGERGAAVWVEFKGVKPDNMLEAIDAITEGKFNSEGVFVADTLMMTCPSTYEAGQPKGEKTIVVPRV